MYLLTPLLALILTGCPTKVDSNSGTPGTAASPGPAPIASEMPGPPPGVPKGGDQLQREIGALSKTGLALKDSVTGYIERTAKSGLLTVGDGYDGTNTVSFVRFHDPVRQQAGRGYLVLGDFVEAGAEPGAFFTVAFWLKEMPKGYRVIEAVVQAHPAKRDGVWVRMEHFEVSDAVAPPVK